MTNKPNHPIQVYGFSKSKYQIHDLIDSVAKLNKGYFIEDGRYYGELLLNKVDTDGTTTYYIFFFGDDFEWLNNSDTTRLALVDIGAYVDRRRNNRPLTTELDDVLKNQLKTTFDSEIIETLTKISNNSRPYLITKLGGDKENNKWMVCRGNNQQFCDTILLK